MNAELNRIQQELKAPKGQTNSFGNYKYRSCEDILEAVKPLLNGLTLTLSDEVVNVGTANYVKATATLYGEGEHFGVTAYAREAETKKGMDEAQITGAASSYARKYALNGLFAIDDTKDADTQDNTQHIPNVDPLADIKQKARVKMAEHGFTGKTALEMTEIFIGKKLPVTRKDYELLIEKIDDYDTLDYHDTADK